MIVNDRITAYLNSLDMGNGDFLDGLAVKARAEGIPIIRRETESLLKVLVAAGQPAAILEVGTAVGYSSLIMSLAMPAGCHITTIEKYERRIPAARENFKRAGRESDITLLEGDAEEILPSLAGPFDFIFMDAAKGQYLGWLPEILRLLSPGGFLVSDNVLQGGDIAESRYVVERRNRTIHGRMREYLYALKRHPELETAILPLGDGVAVSVKRECKENDT